MSNPLSYHGNKNMNTTDILGTTSRRGKIARLPHAVVEQVNHRLLDHERTETLLAWLNALPEVRAVLAGQFDRQPITKQNLSNWRRGGFIAWRVRRGLIAAFTATLAAPAPPPSRTPSGIVGHSPGGLPGPGLTNLDDQPPTLG